MVVVVEGDGSEVGSGLWRWVWWVVEFLNGGGRGVKLMMLVVDVMVVDCKLLL